MPDVCLVVPCFNEAARLKGADFLAHLAADPGAHFCFVNDGSTDATSQAIESLAAQAPGRIITLNLSRNGGKAEAVRQGVTHVAALQRFPLTGYWDADLATPLSELAPMVEVLDRYPGCQLVLGSRWRRLGSDIRRNPMRHALGRVFATVASLVLGLPVYDSQCGAKVCRTSIAGVLFGEPFSTRWLFDVELLARLRNHMPDAVDTAAREVALSRWHDIGGSRLGPLQMAQTPLGFLKIRARYRR